MAGLGKDGDAEPYDNAQKDEVLRLAYVGITRAVSIAIGMWKGRMAKGRICPRASDRMPKGKAFFEDLRGGAVDGSDKR
jgi:ATP-dependent exoDNAse (exonuclease V) beta subunit